MSPMEDKISLKEAQRQWQILLKRKKDSDGLRMAPRRRHFDTTTTFNVKEKEDTDDNHQLLPGDDDPFDCSDLRVPSVAGLVDEMAATWVQEWKDLDERKIIVGPAPAAAGEVSMNENNDNNNNNNDASNNEPTTATASRKRPYWLDKHVRLPEHFDYATLQAGPPPPTDDDMNDDRVLSLQDPTKTTSYHAELWKLFASIPTANQLEQDAIAGGMRLPHSTRLRNEMAKDGSNNNKYRDLYGLSRLRMSDRHCFPSSPPASSSSVVPIINQPEHSSQVHVSAAPSQSPPPPVGSIVLECWRRQPKRGSMPDPSRAVLEFLGSQTLHDVHCALVDLTEDEFWKQVVVLANANADSSSTRKTKEESSSGMFFIEDIFYTTGSVDYVTPIQDWLHCKDKKSHESSSSRALGLGINQQQPGKSLDLPVISMKETRLDEIEMRLGVRYLHVHHGNVECAVFLVDRHYSCTAVDTLSAAAATCASSSSTTATTTCTTTTTSPFPLLHDVWTPTFATPDCEACSTAAPHSGRGRPAVMATATTCAVTDGHRALCLDCARQLALSMNGIINATTTTNTQTTDAAADTTGQNNKKQKSLLLLQPYSVWRGQADIATDACGDKHF